MSEQFKSIETTELVKIANAIRTKTGTTDKISLEDMPAKIAAIEGGTTLPELENEGAASDLLSGKELIDDEGNVVTGTFTIDSELTAQDNLIAQIQSALEGKTAGGEPVLQSKTVSPSTSAQTVKPDSGYDGLSQVTVNAMTTATQATPSITVNSSGLITASSTQTAGYVAAGTKSATKQLTTKAATTYTPTTSNQTIAAGTYCSGAQTIKGDSNLKAENIAEGVSIFGITGTHSGGGSSGTVETCTVQLSMPANYNLAYYYLENGEIKCATAYLPFAATNDLLSQIGKSMTNVVKGSFLICGESGLTFNILNLTLSGSVEKISDNEANSIGAVFKINGDCSITIS